MDFTVLRKTVGNMYLLSGDDHQEAIAKPMPVFDANGKNKVGKVVETIGRVKQPYYLAVLDNGEKLVGTTIKALLEG